MLLAIDYALLFLLNIAIILGAQGSNLQEYTRIVLPLERSVYASSVVILLEVALVLMLPFVFKNTTSKNESVMRCFVMMIGLLRSALSIPIFVLISIACGFPDVYPLAIALGLTALLLFITILTISD